MQYVSIALKANDAQTDRTKSQRTKDKLLQYMNQHSLRLHPMQEKLIEITSHKPQNDMMASADEMQLLANLVKYMGFKKTIDIGVYTGYSALSVALALPDDGKVIAYDINDDFVSTGKPIWKEAGVDGKIELRLAPAVETLQKLIDAGEAGTFDFAFIDADKVNYDTYYEMCLKLLRSGGLIAVDNTLWNGRVIDDAEQDEHTLAIRAINSKIAKDDRVDISLLAIGDGTTLVFKK